MTRQEIIARRDALTQELQRVRQQRIEMQAAESRLEGAILLSQELIGPDPDIMPPEVLEQYIMGNHSNEVEKKVISE